MDNKVMKDILNLEPIILKEYGRNTQNIVNYILKIEDREKRSQYAKTLIEIMRQVNPSMRDAQDSYHKIWDHLYLMAGFKLEVDCPYPMPEVSNFDKKPMKVEYNTHYLNFKHYGRNVELMIQKAIDLKDKPEEQEAAIIYVGRLMKRFYGSWNKENIDDAVIVEHLHLISKNKLKVDVERVKSEHLFDSPKEKESTRDFSRGSSNQSSSNGYSHRGKTNNNNGTGKNPRYQDSRNQDRNQDRRKRN